VFLRTRCTIEGRRYPVGTIVTIPADRLRVAVWLCANGSARPADDRTRLDVELHQLLQAALGASGPTARRSAAAGAQVSPEP